MAIYTKTLRAICEELYTKSTGKVSDDPLVVIPNTAPLVFNFEFTIFSESYRGELIQKIVEHFYFREIGLETYAKFKVFLRNRMQTAMAKLNPLYLAAVNINDVNSDDYTITHNKLSDSQKVGWQDGHTIQKDVGESWNLHSDTPQGGITGLETGEYLSDADKNNVNNSSDNVYNLSSSEKNESKDRFTESRVGRSGRTQAENFNLIREAVVSVDELVYNELASLFMGVY